MSSDLKYPLIKENCEDAPSLYSYADAFAHSIRRSSCTVLLRRMIVYWLVDSNILLIIANSRRQARHKIAHTSMRFPYAFKLTIAMKYCSLSQRFFLSPQTPTIHVTTLKLLQADKNHFPPVFPRVLIHYEFNWVTGHGSWLGLGSSTIGRTDTQVLLEVRFFLYICVF